MALLTSIGRTSIAASMKDQEIYLAWGTGSDSWGDTPPEDGLITATSLANEIGRRKCDFVEFCTPDEQGSIITPSGRFNPSVEATNLLHISVAFDFEDGAGHKIREFGIFTRTQLDPSVPVGQRYVTPDLVVDPGLLLSIERCAPIYRQAMAREIENFIITF